MHNGGYSGRYSEPYKGHITKSDSDSDLGTYVPRDLTSVCDQELQSPNPKSSGTYTRERATFGFGEALR